MEFSYEPPIEQMTPQKQCWIYSNPINGFFQCKRPVLFETEKAVCFNNSDDPTDQIPVWIPKSQMKMIYLPETNSTRYFIKLWLEDKFRVLFTS